MSRWGVAEVVAASSLGVVCWVADGRPRARGVVPLVRDGRPALAFTYADEQVARSLAGTTDLRLVLGEHRSTGGAFRPLVVGGRPRLVEDPTGDVFIADLVVQELRKYPPSRALADSPLLMREHWWYLPRLVVEVDVEAVEDLPGTPGAHDHTLAVATGAGLVVRSARVVERRGEQLRLDLAGEPAPAGPAVLLGQDASFPDLEQWSQWRYLGSWDGTALQVDEAPASTGLGPAPGLIRRWRRQRALERACVAAIPTPPR